MTPINSVSLTREIIANAETKLNPGKLSGSNFGEHMQKALTQVADAQLQSVNIAQAFERGDETDVAKVMLAREKASLAFEATMQIRNKLLSAYKDIVSMPV